MNDEARISTLSKFLSIPTLALFIFSLSTAIHAQPSQNVKIVNPAGKPAYVSSVDKNIPFYCNEIIAPVFAAINASCFRADNRSSVTPVPNGFRLLVTDIVTNRNALIEEGSFFLSVGRAGGGSGPISPKFDFSGDQAQSPAIHFNSPYVVLQPGENLRVFNGDSLGNTVDVFISGYIVRTRNFGR